MSDTNRDMVTFDPRALRVFSILPDEDKDEAYCVRHNREMRQIDPIMHHNGGLFTTTENFSVYSCSKCVGEAGQEHGGDPDGGIKRYRAALVKAFDQWDEGEAPGNWFQFLSEGTLEENDSDAKFAAFGGKA